MKQITHSLTQEVEEVKSTVAASSTSIENNIFKEAPSVITQINEDIEEVTGPIKRKM